MPKVDIFPISSNKRPYSKRLHIYVALQTLREKYDYVKGNRAYYFIRPDFMKTFKVLLRDDCEVPTSQKHSVSNIK